MRTIGDIYIYGNNRSVGSGYDILCEFGPVYLSDQIRSREQRISAAIRACRHTVYW